MRQNTVVFHLFCTMIGGGRFGCALSMPIESRWGGGIDRFLPASPAERGRTARATGRRAGATKGAVDFSARRRQ